MRLTFPDDEDFPVGVSQFFKISPVTFNISAAFILPESGICGRCDPAKTTAVYVPETAVNEDYFFVLWKDEVRNSG